MFFRRKVFLRLNYVICCWSGNRRVKDQRVVADPAFYLRSHLDALKKYPHNLAQITIVVPYNHCEPPAYRKYLQQHLPRTIQDAEVVVLERRNVGLSYGSFAYCYAIYRTAFDFYFFAEDDYIFTQKNFDSLHVQIMKTNPQCGYICGMAWDGYKSRLGVLPCHAAVPHGLLRTEALEKVFNKHRCIPHARSADYLAGEMGGQVAQSSAIIDAGYTLMDWAGRYKVGYRENLLDPNASNIVYFHSDCAEVILEPI